MSQYSISSPTPDIQVTELLIKFLLFPLSRCKMPVAHLLWAHHSDVISSDPESKLHVLVFILNLATHILHPFSSSKVNKNKFQDFLKSLIFLSHESAEMSNSHMFDESWQPVHHRWEERTSHYLCQGDVWLPSDLLKKITAPLLPGVTGPLNLWILVTFCSLELCEMLGLHKEQLHFGWQKQYFCWTVNFHLLTFVRTLTSSSHF